MIVGYENFPREFQLTDYTCGACCTYMIASHFNYDVSYAEVKEELGTDEDGTPVSTMVRYLRSLGLRVAPRIENKHTRFPF